jgi:1,4-dihydroxy-2-naphthoate octaprenyltransferase
MATPAQWLEGARPRTLPAALAPVAVGTGAAAAVESVVWWRALLCLVVALALQVAVNYANDYSDGIRGTDADRVGPLRLVGSGVAAPRSVKRAAYAAFGVAAAAGLALAVTAQAWWLIAVGAVSILAAWFYTGGSRPYGYRGFGEISVFVFFGLVAVIGTAYVQAERLTLAAVLGGVGAGALACALLVANNLRDIPTDVVAGKRTLAVLLGDPGSRRLYAGLVAVAFLVILALVGVTPWVLIALATAVAAIKPLNVVLRDKAVGRQLVPVLRDTGRLQLIYGVLLGIGLALG